MAKTRRQTGHFANVVVPHGSAGADSLRLGGWELGRMLEQFRADHKLTRSVRKRYQTLALCAATSGASPSFVDFFLHRLSAVRILSPGPLWLWLLTAALVRINVVPGMINARTS